MGWFLSLFDLLVGVMPLGFVLAGRRAKRKFGYRAVVTDSVVLVLMLLWCAWWLYRDRVHWGVWIGLVFSFVGTILVVQGVMSWRSKFRKSQAPETLDPTDVPEWIPAVLWLVYWNFPQVFQFIFYRLIISHWPALVLLFLMAIVVGWTFRRIRATGIRNLSWYKAAGYFGLVSFFPLAFLVMVPESNRMWRIRFAFPFTERDEIVDLDGPGFRFSSLEDAYGMMITHLQLSEARIDHSLVSPAIVDGGSGYAVPLVGSTWFARWLHENPGIAVVSDNSGDIDQVRKTKESFATGPGMFFPRDLARRLCRSNPFCEYGEIFPSQLTGEDPSLWVLIAPQIRQTFHFPILIPEWTGVTIVFPTGRVESLTMSQVRSDPRLAGRALFPESLARLYAEAQQYPYGIATREGQKNLIELPRLPGTNQYPFLVKGDDGHHYHMTLVEPLGTSEGLSAAYYVDSFTGERTVKRFAPDSGLIGPMAAIRVVTSAPGRNWESMDSVTSRRDQEFESRATRQSSGPRGVIYAGSEPKLFRREGRYHMFVNVISSQFAPATAFAVDIKSQAKVEFPTRQSFDEWYMPTKGETAPATTQASR